MTIKNKTLEHKSVDDYLANNSKRLPVTKNLTSFGL